MFRTVLTSLLAVLVLCGSAFAAEKTLIAAANPTCCLLYTSDAADD